MQPTIELAKSSNTLNKLTFVLLYATDFADRLEKEIIPALKAGFIVLSDRYIFTALARAGVRGIDRQWLRNLSGFAIGADGELSPLAASPYPLPGFDPPESIARFHSCLSLLISPAALPRTTASVVARDREDARTE